MMKYTRILGKMALIALAAVCLLAAPALSMPMGDGSCRPGHGGMFALKNNLTPEEMDNMTLGELKEMQKEAMNQSQLCPAMGEGQNCSQNCRNGDAFGQMMGRDGPNGQMMGRDEPKCVRSQGAGPDDGAPRGMLKGNPAILLMDDLNMEDLANMTVKQVKDLIQTKMQELDNMTLAQIKQLEMEKMQMKENLTLYQLKEENRNRQEMAGILGLAAARPQLPA